MSINNVNVSVFVHNRLPVAEVYIYQEVNITLRVTGRKDNVITAQIIEDGTVIQEYSVVRDPGNPDTQSQTFTMQVKPNHFYDVKLVYEANHNGENPVWLTFELNGQLREFYTEFNTDYGYYQELLLDSSYYTLPVDVEYYQPTTLTVANELVYTTTGGELGPLYLAHGNILDCSLYVFVEEEGLILIEENSDYTLNYEIGEIDISQIAPCDPDWIFYAFYNATIYPPINNEGEVLEANSIVLDASGSYDLDGEIVSYSWSFENRRIGNTAVVEVTFDVAGLYEIELVLVDDMGAVTRETFEIVVYPNLNILV